MKSTALVSLDCVNGTAIRYLRIAGNKPRETGRLTIPDWKADDERVDWSALGEFLRGWRGRYVPPEDEGPRPTPPLRTAKMARTA